jgi:hypothetical protein
MTWILLVFFGTSHSAATVPTGFSAEFNDLQSCLAAYAQYVKVRPENIYGKMSGVCVPKGEKK